MKPFFVSCAIDYPNASLHMGHLYEKTIADVLARAHRLNGENVLFSVGADEHGEKVQEAAKKVNLSPQAYVDKMAAEFKQLFALAGVSNDVFVRTTSSEHVKAVRFFFQKIMDTGDIYLSEYEGWYCVSDETFWTQKDLVEGKCPNSWCGKPVKKTKEDSYFFRWSKYQRQLESWLDELPLHVFPEFRKNEMKTFLAHGLHDVSFTRKNISWGIPAPVDPTHTIYVWGDALVNYLTVAGYPDKKFADFWPADLHVIGMDINRFHSLLWPAMLLSAGLPLPKQVLVHGFVNDEKGEKMSKSVGNVIDPLKIIPVHGVEAIRYYLLREVPLGNDLAFSEANLIQRTNAELADGLGNLVYRVLSMLEKYSNSRVPTAPLDEALLFKARERANESYLAYLSHDLQNALISAWKVVDLGNKYVTDAEPWKMMKEGQRVEVEALLATEVELVRILSILIAPVLPQTSQSICAQFGFDAPAFAALGKPPSFAEKPVKKGAILFVKKELPAPASPLARAKP